MPVEEVLWAHGQTVRSPRPIAHAFRLAPENPTAHGYAWATRSMCERATLGARAAPEARRCKECEGALVRVRLAARLRGGGDGEEGA
jgi:hypothetical protein